MQNTNSADITSLDARLDKTMDLLAQVNAGLELLKKDHEIILLKMGSGAPVAAPAKPAAPGEDLDTDFSGGLAGWEAPPEAPQIGGNRDFDNSSESLSFLRDNDFFGSLDDSTLRAVFARGKLCNFPAGTNLFNRGEVCDTAFVIRGGVVEIQRAEDEGEPPSSVAFLGTGHIMVEMGIFTGAAHRSTARIPEGAEILVLPYKALKELIVQSPTLALHICKVFAKRLEGVVVSLGTRRDKGSDLEGRFTYFDLGSVIQALLTGDDHCGTLSVYNSAHLVLAELKIDHGRIHQARFGQQLKGPEAFYQLFQADLSDGQFHFREKGENDDTPVVWDEELRSAEGTSLLLEAMRLKDETVRLKKSIDPEKTFVRAAQRLEWDDPASLDMAEVVWKRLEQQSIVKALAKDVPCCEFVLYDLLSTMLEAGLIKSSDA